MRKWAVLALLLAMVCVSACAIADNYGVAVVYARNSSRVHLREEATAQSASMGLYFTGTEVECLSDPTGEWVHVRIGVEEGYMKSDYLRTGERAERVYAEFQTGVVDVKNYIRLRRGPSTEYQMLGELQAGTVVTIMGETESNWYYVQVGNKEGYVSANLIDLQVKQAQSGVSSRPEAYGSSWKEVYRAYAQRLAGDRAMYALIYVDGDSIPELVIDHMTEAGGCEILTYANGSADVLQTERRRFTYLNGENRLCNSDGISDSYFDAVYTIENGKWRQIAFGEYYGYHGGWSDEYERYICKYYAWNGIGVTMEQYMASLDAIYDLDRSISVGGMCSYAQIMEILKD